MRKTVALAAISLAILVFLFLQTRDTSVVDGAPTAANAIAAPRAGSKIAAADAARSPSNSSPTSSATHQVGLTPNSQAASDLHAAAAGSTRFEARLLTNGFVNSRAMALLSATEFDAAVTALDAQNSGRANAQSGKYREAIENTLSAIGERATLTRFSCGAHICLGSVRAAAGSASFGWLEQFPTLSDLHIGAFATQEVLLSDGLHEQRLLLTFGVAPSGFAIDALPP